MTCNRCGNNLPDNAGFCPYCGTQFESDNAPQTGYAPPAYQPENAGQYYVDPAQETQPQYEAPVQYEAAESATPESPKKKKPVVGIIFAVVAVILVVGLAGLNVFQYLKAEDVAEELTDAHEQITKMEAKAGELEEENTDLNNELTQLKGDYDALADQAVAFEESITEYENKVNALESENTALSNSVADYETQLENSGAAIETYALISEFLSSEYADDYRANSHFYGGTNIVFVKLGQSTTIDVTFITDETEPSITYSWNTSYVDVTTEPFDTVCPVVITGVGAGYSTIEFANSVDSASFEILVIVVE